MKFSRVLMIPPALCSAAILLSSCNASGVSQLMPQPAIDRAAPARNAGPRFKLAKISYTRIKLSLNGVAISGSGSNVYVVESRFPGGTQADAIATISGGKLVSEVSFDTSSPTQGLAVGSNGSLFFPFSRVGPPTVGVYANASQKYSDFTQPGTLYSTGVVTTASDRSLWSGSIGSSNEDCYIARFTTSGKTQEFTYGSYAASKLLPVNCEPPSIAQGSDSRIWWPDGGAYVYKSQNYVVSPSVFASTLKGTITQYPLPTTLKSGGDRWVRWVFSLLPSTDGNLWASALQLQCYYSGGCNGKSTCEFMRITTGGTITEFPLKNTYYGAGCGPPAAVDQNGFIWMPTFGTRDTGGISRSYMARSNRNGRVRYFNFLPLADMKAGAINNMVPYTDSQGYVYFSYGDTTTKTGYIIRVQPDDS